MPLATDTQLGMAMRFLVTIDETKVNLGSWSKASGLDVAWDLVEYRAGDAGNDRWFFPGNTKYSTIKLERAAESAGTPAVHDWLNSNSFAHKPCTGSIELQDAKKATVMKWTLRHVIPVKWAVTAFEASASKVALETLELAHMGFLTKE